MTKEQRDQFNVNKQMNREIHYACDVCGLQGIVNTLDKFNKTVDLMKEVNNRHDSTCPNRFVRFPAYLIKGVWKSCAKKPPRKEHADEFDWDMYDYYKDHNMSQVWKFILELQINYMHLKEHVPNKLPCAVMEEDEDEPGYFMQKGFCFPDLARLMCPRCYNYSFRGYSMSDEHDTYWGMKCDTCNYDYSISH